MSTPEFLLVLVALLAAPAGVQGACLDNQGVLAKIMKDYDKSKTPGESPRKVEVQLWIDSARELSLAGDTVLLNLYINQKWDDPGLEFGRLDPCNQNVSISRDFVEKLWQPMGSFVGSGPVDILQSPFANVFCLIFENGTVWLNYRAKVKAFCTTNLDKYPLDEAKCSLLFQSWKYSTSEVKMEWVGAEEGPIMPVKSTEELQPAGFSLRFHTNKSTASYPAGAFDILTANFYFRRQISWSVFHSYAPAGVLVVFAWVSLLVNPKFLIGRIVMITGAVLGLLALYLLTAMELPRGGCLSNLDKWILGCLGFVFWALIHSVMGSCCGCCCRGGRKCGRRESEEQSYLVHDSDEGENPSMKHLAFDFVAAVLFPILFGAFVAVYILFLI